MEMHVCLIRVSTVACVKMRSDRTPVTVPLGLKDKAVRSVKPHGTFTPSYGIAVECIEMLGCDCDLISVIPELCESENGGCEHFCSVTQKNVVCSCADGYKLGSNGKSCQSDGNVTPQ